MSLRERFGGRRLIDNAEVFKWFTLVLELVIAGLLSYALFSVVEAFQELEGGLLIRGIPIRNAILAILVALVVYMISRRLDPLMAKETFIQGLYTVGIFTLVLWCVLFVVSLPTILLVGLAQYLLSPFQQTLGLLYSIILWGIGIVTVGIAGWLFLRDL